MEFDPENQEIIKLITKLKNASGEYPDQLLAARRQSYLKRMAEIGMGISAGTGIENAAQPGNGSVPAAPTSMAASTLVEIILVVAIVAEAGAAVYFYRGKLAKFFQTITAVARGEEVTPPTAVTTSLEIQGVSPSPIVTATLPTATISPSPSGTVVVQSSTPIPGVVNDNNPGINQMNSTPAPNGNNGNHYGQTPKPERTKQPQNNNDTPPKDNGNNNQPSDQSSKPTKTK